jgi:hypothetical protein
MEIGVLIILFRGRRPHRSFEIGRRRCGFMPISEWMKERRVGYEMVFINRISVPSGEIWGRINAWMGDIEMVRAWESMLFDNPAMDVLFSLQIFIL